MQSWPSGKIASWLSICSRSRCVIPGEAALLHRHERVVVVDLRSANAYLLLEVAQS
jgi:hypothetical protein